MTDRKETADIPKEILCAWKEGSREAFQDIVTASMKRAYAVALGILGNAEDARDLSQEAFMIAHRARATFDTDRPFFPWFYRILRNRCLNCIRRRSVRREISLDVLVERPSTAESPERESIRRERARMVWKAIQELSPDHREIIVLRSFEDLSYREIADTLCISQGTVMSRLYYARRALYEKLGGLAEEIAGEGEVER